MAAEQNEQLIIEKEARNYLAQRGVQITRKTFWSWRKSGVIRSRMIGGRVYVEQSSLEKLFSPTAQAA